MSLFLNNTIILIHSVCMLKWHVQWNLWTKTIVYEKKIYEWRSWQRPTIVSSMWKFTSLIGYLQF